MPAEPATALVVRTTDWSETSRIATLFTREFGRLRVLAKGGKRLKSSFDLGLDVLAVCRVAVIRKSAGGLDLLTEAQLAERFPDLRTHLPAYYAALYVAELLSELTQDDDPHPALFDAALDCLRELTGPRTSARLAAFELTLLGELGYSPALRECAACGTGVGSRAGFSPVAGGVVCADCGPHHRDRRPVSPAALDALRQLAAGDWRADWPIGVRTDWRRLLGEYVTVRLGKRPRLLPYLTG